MQNQLLYNHDLKIKFDKSKQTNENDFKTIKQTQEQLEALESELVMQESINENKIRDIQINLNHQIDEINQTKEVEMESLKSRYADLFNEKAQESEILRSEFGDSQVKIQQQSRTISDLEFKEKELNDLLSKKQKCHHKEFDRTYSELESEIEFLREISPSSVVLGAFSLITELAICSLTPSELARPVRFLACLAGLHGCFIPLAIFPPHLLQILIGEAIFLGDDWPLTPGFGR